MRSKGMTKRSKADGNGHETTPDEIRCPDCDYFLAEKIECTGPEYLVILKVICRNCKGRVLLKLSPAGIMTGQL